MVIDAGHGGDDIGARSGSGAEEKQITLQVARRLRALIEARLGIRVILTRDDDTRMSLDDRAAVANNSKADLFRSSSARMRRRSLRSASEVLSDLRLDRDGEKVRTAATNAVALPVLGGATRSIDVIRWDLAQARHVDASAALGSIAVEGAHVVGFGAGQRRAISTSGVPIGREDHRGSCRGPGSRRCRPRCVRPVTSPAAAAGRGPRG